MTGALKVDARLIQEPDMKSCLFICFHTTETNQTNKYRALEDRDSFVSFIRTASKIWDRDTTNPSETPDEESQNHRTRPVQESLWTTRGYLQTLKPGNKTKN